MYLGRNLHFVLWLVAASCVLGMSAMAETSSTAENRMTNATTTNCTTSDTDPCRNDSCGSNSTCKSRYGDAFECVCSADTEFYNNTKTTCDEAKFVPGRLLLQNMLYSDCMAEKKSQEFLNSTQDLKQELETVFQTADLYWGSFVRKLKAKENTEDSSHFVIAVVDLFFDPSTNITEDDISRRFRRHDSEPHHLLYDAKFNARDIPTPIPPSTTIHPSADPCDNNPCADGSTCVPRFGQQFVCLCSNGKFYINETCADAKEFPGLLHVQMNYVAAMNDTKSLQFLQAQSNILHELRKVFAKSDDFLESVLLTLNQHADFLFRSAETVNAKVEIFFSPDSEITARDILEITEQYVKENPNTILAEEPFIEDGKCESENPCDQTTTECRAILGSVCLCREGYIEAAHSDNMCTACPSGQMAVSDTHCVDCAFGYSGLNCNESWLLVLVIVASVLGGILLIVLIVLCIVGCISSKNTNVDVNAHIISPSNGSANTFANAGLLKIPRASPSRS